MPDDIKNAAPHAALTVMVLFEAMVVQGASPNDFAVLVNQARELVSLLPPEQTGLGALDRVHPDAALAWCITHFGDPLYREARAAAQPPAQDQQPPHADSAHNEAWRGEEAGTWVSTPSRAGRCALMAACTASERCRAIPCAPAQGLARG